MNAEAVIIKQLLEMNLMSMDIVQRNKEIRKIIALLEELIEPEENSNRKKLATTTKQDEPVEMLTVKECTEQFKGLTPYSVRQLAFSGKIVSIRAGEGKRGKMLINKMSLQNYLNNKKV